MNNVNYELTGERNAETTIISGFMTRVYAWMGFALLLTALTAFAVANSENAMNFIFGNQIVFWVMIIGEFALVIAISAAINKISAQTASFLFVLYSLLTGATLSSVFFIYTKDSIASAFVVTAGMFILMSFYGMVTKKDLSKLGNILIMALIGLIIASVVNLFWANSTLYWVITYAGVLIFVGLTAYDTQKLKKIAAQAEEKETIAKLSILGALTLYLDFINLFLYLLRVIGKRK